MKKSIILLSVILSLMSCKQKEVVKNGDLATIMTAAPGHFHAALIQKNMYPMVDSQVYVFAPDGPEVKDYLSRIDAFNRREVNPTSWKTDLYVGEDFFEKMIMQKPGNLVTLAGNNRNKTEYILACIKAGLNVLSDKPMAIESSDFELLKEAYALAAEKGLLLSDIMTERYEITTILQREFSMQESVFGKLQTGSIDDPAITKESVHHFSKVISGIPLIRPPWFFDAKQQGEAIADVGTHLVDMIQWEAFPGEIINYDKDIVMLISEKWPTKVSLEQFCGVTGLNGYPGFLETYIIDDTLNADANSMIQYTLRGIHAKVSVEWKYQAPEGAGDTHYSIMRGSLSDLVIKQGPEENYKPMLYIRASEGVDKATLAASVDLYLNEDLLDKYPGISVEPIDEGVWRVNVPQKYRIGHEAHFEQVSLKFLEYLQEGRIPDAEMKNTLSKYYTTTRAVEMAR